jgi:GT2 family glycosyltransferase
MRLSVVVVNWNSRDDLRACLSSLRSQTHADLEIIVVDNGSTDGSAEMMEEHFPEWTLLRQAENLGFAEACNRGIEASTGEWVAMLNNDTVAEPDWATELGTAAESCLPNCGMLQSLLLFQARPDTINSTGIELTRSGGGRDRAEGHPRDAGVEPENIFCPTAGAAAYRRSMLESIKLPEGYFDRTHFMYYEDLDLGWRARLAGWSALYIPRSAVFHKWHGSSNRHGRPWLVVIANTNRIRTLCKNASLGFLLRTAPQTLIGIAEILWYGRFRALRTLAQGTIQSIRQRSTITRLVRVHRRALEREWTVA